MLFLLAVLVAGSFGMGLVLLAFCGRVWVPRAGRASALILGALAIVLLLQVDAGTSIRGEWIRGLGSVGLTLHAPGIYLAAMVFWLLPLTHLGRSAHPPPVQEMWYRSGLLHLLCALVAASVTVNHFLARIVLLDVTTWCLMILLVLELRRFGYCLPLTRRYLLFRLGDMGLLLLVLLVWQASGTLEIEQMLDHARSLPAGLRAVILVGGLLAAWIKMGLPPAHRWLQESDILPLQARVWAAGAVLPLLGTYLLYRLQPLLVSLGLGGYLAMLGAVIALWSLVHLRDGAWRAGSGFYWLALHSALGLMLAGTALMGAFLLAFLPVRTVLCVVFSGGTQLSLDAQRAVRSGRRQWRRLPIGPIEAVAWLEERVLGVVHERVARAILWLAHVAASVLERRVLDGLVDSAVRGVHWISRVLQARHTGRLRRNLAWVFPMLIVVIAMILSWRG